MTRLALMAEGFGGGTRLGPCLRLFNERYAKAALGRRSVFIVMSDGYDTAPPEELAAELARLKRRVRRLIWLNPLLGWQRYAPVNRAMAAALPFVDHFAAAHSLDGAGGARAGAAGAMSLSLAATMSLVEELRHRGEDFCLVTVIRTANATSAKAGAKAVVTGDGALHGFVGGGCVQGAVTRTARRRAAGRRAAPDPGAAEGRRRPPPRGSRCTIPTARAAARSTCSSSRCCSGRGS